MIRKFERKFRCTYLYRKFKRCVNPLDFHIDEEGPLLCRAHQFQIHERCVIRTTEKP